MRKLLPLVVVIAAVLAVPAIAATRTTTLKDDYFAKSSVVDGIYKVDSSVGQGLDKKIDDFRQKKPAAK